MKNGGYLRNVPKNSEQIKSSLYQLFTAAHIHKWQIISLQNIMAINVVIY